MVLMGLPVLFEHHALGIWLFTSWAWGPVFIALTIAALFFAVAAIIDVGRAGVERWRAHAAALLDWRDARALLSATLLFVAAFALPLGGVAAFSLAWQSWMQDVAWS